MVDDTWPQALVSMYMGSRMLNLGIALLLSKVVNNFLSFVRKLLI